MNHINFVKCSPGTVRCYYPPSGREARKGDIVETSVRTSVRPSVRASEHLTLYLRNPWAQTNDIWHVDPPPRGKGHCGEFDLICILIRSRGQQGQKSTLAHVHFTIEARLTKFLQDIHLTLGHSKNV